MLQVQFIDKVEIVLMQLNFQQSRVVCTGSSSTECWTFQLRTERVPTVLAVQKTSWRRRHCDQQRKVPAVQRFESCAPDSVHPLSGEYSCCATDFRRDSTGAVLGGMGSFWHARVCATTGAFVFLPNFHIFYVNVDSDLEAEFDLKI